MTEPVGPLARTLSVPYYEDALPAHDVYHADRVRHLAARLADAADDPVERDVLAAAAWFHDIGRPKERTGAIDDHGRWAAAEVEPLLAAESVPEATIERVQHCLRSHSIRDSSPDPETIEAELLFDADKLDAVGAVGIVRLACIVGERSGRAGDRYAVIDDASRCDVDAGDHPDVSLLREWAADRLDALYTAPARRLGADRWAFLETFFAQFEREVGPAGTR